MTTSIFLIIPADRINLLEFTHGKTFTTTSIIDFRDKLEKEYDCTLTYYTTNIGFCNALNNDEIDTFGFFVSYITLILND